MKKDPLGGRGRLAAGGIFAYFHYNPLASYAHADPQPPPP